MQQFLSELHLRLVTLNSEPNGIVRETMIQNFLIDEDLYLKHEKQQMEIIFIDSRKIDCECDIWNCKGDAKKYESFEQYYNENY